MLASTLSSSAGVRVPFQLCRPGPRLLRKLVRSVSLLNSERRNAWEAGSTARQHPLQAAAAAALAAAAGAHQARPPRSRPALHQAHQALQRHVAQRRLRGGVEINEEVQRARVLNGRPPGCRRIWWGVHGVCVGGAARVAPGMPHVPHVRGGTCDRPSPRSRCCTPPGGDPELPAMQCSTMGENRAPEGTWMVPRSSLDSSRHGPTKSKDRHCSAIWTACARKAEQRRGWASAAAAGWLGHACGPATQAHLKFLPTP